MVNHNYSYTYYNVMLHVWNTIHCDFFLYLLSSSAIMQMSIFPKAVPMYGMLPIKPGTIPLNRTALRYDTTV